MAAADWGKMIGKGLLSAGKAAAAKVAEQKAEMDARQLADLRQQVETRVASAANYPDDEKVQAAITDIPTDWPNFDIAATRKLLRGKYIVALDSALDRAKLKAEWAAKEAEAEAARRERIENIPKLFADKSAQLTLTIDEMYARVERGNSNMGAAWALATRGISDSLTFARLVGDFDERQRTLMKTWFLLHAHGRLSDRDYYALYIPIIYSEGRSRHYDPSDYKLLRSDWDRFRGHMERTSMSEGEAWDRMRQVVLDAETEDDDPTLQELLHDALYGGNSWMRPGEINGTGVFTDRFTPTALLLGPLEEGGAFIREDSEGSLLTVAPSGAGKSQAHVFPNLVMYEGPMIVLDIKGECYEKTAGWRSQSVGPVYRFAPEGESAAYNPLEFIPREDPVAIYEGAFLLAQQLIVPQNTGGDSSYWETQAQGLVAGLIAFVVMNEPDPKKQTMGTVIDLLSPTQDMQDNMIEMMKGSPVRPLRNLGNQLSSMAEKTDKALESIFDTARSKLLVWSTGRLDPITDHSDWSPMDFRGPDRPTLYLSVPLGKVTAYASVLRVIVAQHIFALTQQGLAPPDKPIVMVLDEFPQLGTFMPAVQALEVGRSAGLKLWLVAQDEDQLTRYYGSPETITNKCATRLYMNPPDHTAVRLSRSLGVKDGLLDGDKRPLATPDELTGPEFANKVLVLGRSCRPLQLDKAYAYEIEFIRGRLDWPVV